MVTADDKINYYRDMFNKCSNNFPRSFFQINYASVNAADDLYESCY